MSEQLRLRGDTAANVAAYTGPQREAVVDITNNRLVIQDGVTPGGWPMAKLSEISSVTRTAVEASYSALATDRCIAVISIVAPVYVTLPASSAFQAGARMLVIDESGGASFSKPVITVPQGADVIVGVYSSTIATAYGFLEFESNGAGQWTMTDGAGAGPPGSPALLPTSSPSTIAPSRFPAFSGQAIVGLSQPISAFSIAEPRLEAGMCPVICALNPCALTAGTIVAVSLTAFAPGKIDALAIVTMLDGRMAPSQLARTLFTLNYIGA